MSVPSRLVADARAGTRGAARPRSRGGARVRGVRLRTHATVPAERGGSARAHVPARVRVPARGVPARRRGSEWRLAHSGGAELPRQMARELIRQRRPVRGAIASVSTSRRASTSAAARPRPRPRPRRGSRACGASVSGASKVGSGSRTRSRSRGRRSRGHDGRRGRGQGPRAGELVVVVDGSGPRRGGRGGDTVAVSPARRQVRIDRLPPRRRDRQRHWHRGRGRAVPQVHKSGWSTGRSGRSSGRRGAARPVGLAGLVAARPRRPRTRSRRGGSGL